MSTIRQRAKNIAEKCSDAYYVSAYRSWPAVAKVLLQRGYNDQEVEGIMRSKYARWAYDYHGCKFGFTPAKAILDYIDSLNPNMVKDDVAKFSKCVKI